MKEKTRKKYSLFKSIKKRFNFRKKSSDLVQTLNISEDFKKPKMFNQKDVEKMILLKKKGLSNVKVGKIMKCSEKTVRNYLKENVTPCEMGQD